MLPRAKRGGRGRKFPTIALPRRGPYECLGRVGARHKPQPDGVVWMSQLWRACLLIVRFLPATAALAATPHTSHQTSPQAALDSFAKNLGYHFTLLSNKRTDGCPDKPVQQYCFSARLDLTT